MRNGKATRPASKIGRPDAPLQLAQPAGFHRRGTRTRCGGLRPGRTRRVSAAVPAVKDNKRSEGPFGLTSLQKATATLRFHSTLCMAFHAKEAVPILSRSGTARPSSKFPPTKRMVRRGDLSDTAGCAYAPGWKTLTSNCAATPTNTWVDGAPQAVASRMDAAKMDGLSYADRVAVLFRCGCPMRASRQCAPSLRVPKGFSAREGSPSNEKTAHASRADGQGGEKQFKSI